MTYRAHVAAIALLGASMGAALSAEPLSEVVTASEAGPQGSRGVIIRGSDQFVGRTTTGHEAVPGGTVTLNLVEVPLAVAAKAVISDALGWGYTIDAQAGGTITLQTGGPVTREALLSMFEAALGARGLVLRRRGRTAQILTAGGGVQPVQGPGAEAGSVAVPMRWIAAAEMQSILAAVAPRDVVLRVDRARNLLILSGDAAQIRTLRQTIDVFDVDWMRGMSTAMLPVRTANPRLLARDLTQIFGGEAAGTGDVIRFVPNEALGAILVVSSRAVYLDRARVWLEQLEGMAAERERQLFVYRIQNRSAKELAAVLQGVVASEAGVTASTTAGLGYGGTLATGSDASGLGGASGFGAPGGEAGGFGSGAGSAGQSGSQFGASGFGSSSMGGVGGANASGLGGQGYGNQGYGGQGAGGLGTGGLGTGGLGAGGAGGLGSPIGGAGAGAAYAGGYGAGGYGGGGYGGGGYGADAGMGTGARRDIIGIVPDETNNSLVISATRNQYDKILRILTRLDAMPTQVLLETVIAEVTLNNELQFGVQWFLKNRGDRLNLAQTNTAAVSTASSVTSTGTAVSGTAALVSAATRGIPGFNYLLGGTDFNVVLNALQGVTRVNVISSPNITVLDNRTAKLQIGDQIPIVKQSGQSALTTGAPILNQIEMKDTGVILSVTPRVNKNGLVVLDINQEVSDVVATTSSTINSPTIRQRRVATSVAVSDGHSLAIGGMVQEKAQTSNESVPILGDLPLIGSAFRSRDDLRVRTELIVFIRPKVIRGTVEADRIAEDFRQQFRTMMPTRPVPPPSPMAAPVPGSMGVLRRMID